MESHEIVLVELWLSMIFLIVFLTKYLFIDWSYTATVLYALMDGVIHESPATVNDCLSQTNEKNDLANCDDELPAAIHDVEINDEVIHESQSTEDDNIPHSSNKGNDVANRDNEVPAETIKDEISDEVVHDAISAVDDNLSHSSNEGNNLANFNTEIPTETHKVDISDSEIDTIEDDKASSETKMHVAHPVGMVSSLDVNTLFPNNDEVKAMNNMKIPTSHDVKPPKLEENNDPVSHDDEELLRTVSKKSSDSSDIDIPPASDLKVAHEFDFQRSSSLKEKENPFSRLSDSNIPDSSNAIAENSHVHDENIPKLKDIDMSKPSSEESGANCKNKSSPMVVSVGTIEVNGSSQYEDINIMTKGDSVPEKPKCPEKNSDETIEKNEDYESLRDLRFSSISMYDRPHFEEDIEIIVDDAQKHSAESFVSYKVVTKTSRESFLQHEFHVRRRYQDFLWLSNILIQQYTSNIIPPLPQKKIFNKYDPNFLRLRQLALNKFLCRIAEHPILSTSEHFFAFLSAKQVELIEQKKSVAIKRFSIPQIPISNLVDSPFKITSDYIEEFGKILSSLSLHSNKLDNEQRELVAALNMFPPCVALWANSEGDLEPILTKLGDAIVKTSTGLETMVQTKEEIFTECIKEYQLYTNTVRNVLKARDHLQVTKQYYTEVVLSKQKELEKLEVSEPGKSFATLFGKKPAQVKEERADKFKSEITTLSAEGEAAGDELEVASAAIKSDIERWKINKEKDCKSWLDSVAQAHVTYFEESTQLWESVLQFVDSADN